MVLSLDTGVSSRCDLKSRHRVVGVVLSLDTGVSSRCGLLLGTSQVLIYMQ